VRRIIYSRPSSYLRCWRSAGFRVDPATRRRPRTAGTRRRDDGARRQAVILRKVPRATWSPPCLGSIPALVAPIVGPVVGGFIATLHSWRWIFSSTCDRIAGYWLRPVHRGDGEGDAAATRLHRGSSSVSVCKVASRLENLARVSCRPRPSSPGSHSVSCFTCVRVALPAQPNIRFSTCRSSDRRSRLDHGRALFSHRRRSYTIAMPLMLQEGFGLTPLRSGLLTFAGRRAPS